MVSNLPELQDLVAALGRPLRVATMCSGTESPLLAMDKIGAATVGRCRLKPVLGVSDFMPVCAALFSYHVLLHR